jgi:ferredoxin
MHGQTVLPNRPRAKDFVPSTIHSELALEGRRHSRLCQKGVRLDLACHAADECMGCGMCATKRVVVVVCVEVTPSVLGVAHLEVLRADRLPERVRLAQTSTNPAATTPTATTTTAPPGSAGATHGSFVP